MDSKRELPVLSAVWARRQEGRWYDDPEELENELDEYDLGDLLMDGIDGDGAVVFLAIDAEKYWKAIRHPAGYAMPYWNDSEYNQEFDRLHSEGGGRFGIRWLRVNTVVRDSIAENFDHTMPFFRWLCSKVAYDVCAALGL